MKVSFLIVVITFTILNIAYAKHVKNISIDNNIIFEKAEHEVLDYKMISYHFLEFRMVAHNVIRYNITYTLTQPMNTGWVHFVLYFKNARYTKFLIDIWEDFCAFWGGAGGNPLSELLKENVLRMGVKYNFKWQCPLVGTVTMSHEGFNASKIIFPLLPAGRYRCDVYFARARDGHLYAKMQYYFRISDLRVWY